MKKSYTHFLSNKIQARSLVNNLTDGFFTSTTRQWNSTINVSSDNLASNKKKDARSMILLVGLMLILMSSINSIYATTYYSIATGNWNSRNTWSTTSGGTRIRNGYPGAADNVIIESNYTVTTNVVAACTDINIASGSTLSVGGYNFTSTGTTTVNGTIIHSSTTATKTFADVIISGGTWTSNAGESYALTSLTLSGSTVNGSASGTFNVSTDLAVTAGTLNNLNAFSITVNGTTTIDGSIFFLSTTGTKVFVGQTTINPGGTWDNDNVNEAINFRGGLTNNGTFYAGTSIYTFDTNNQSIVGTLAIPNVTINTITLTNNGNLTVTSALAGSGGITQGLSTSVLNIGVTPAITTMTATTGGNLVNYSGAAQTVKGITYSNLTISGSGIKTTTGITVNGVLSMEGTATLTAAPAYGASATLQYNTGTARNAGVEWTSPFTGTGGIVITNTGAISMNSPEVLNTSVPLTIKSSAALITGNNQLTLGGDFNNSGTFTPGTGTVTMNGVAQTIGGTSATTFNNLTLSNSGIKTLTTVPIINGVLSMEGNATISAATAPSFGGSATLQYKGSSIQTTGAEFPSVFNGSGGLIINNSNGVTLGAAKTIGTTSKLTLVSGNISTTPTNLLSVTNNSVTAITGGSTTSFINGPVKWTLPASLISGSTYNFPVGSGSSYLPFSLVNPTTGTGTVTTQVQAIIGNSGGAIDGTLNSKSTTEYWTLATSGNFTNSSISLIRPTAITPNDAIGGSTSLAGTYLSLGGVTGTYGVSNSNPIGTNRYFVLAQNASTISTGTITGSPFCAGSVVSVPFTITGTYTPGNVFTAQLSNSTGSFASPVNIGTLTSTTAGTISATIPIGTLIGSGYRIRVTSSAPVKTGTDNGSNLTINSIPIAATTTGGLICIGSTATLSAAGAGTGDKYKWYDAAAGGNLLKTSTDFSDNTYVTAVLGATTNFWVSILNAGGCEGTRTLVTATYPSVSTDTQTPGSNSWIGYVYDGNNLNSYYGHYTEPELFDESFGGATNCFGFTSNSVTRSIYTETFSVRYLMNSTKKGLYTVDLGSDDGSRLTVDGTLLYNNWSDQAFTSRPTVLMNLTGTSSLTYDFYENGGENRAVYQNLTQLLANNLTTNTSQSISVGSTGTTISGDVYGTLPSGISLSGTGYQWTYSTTPAGIRTNITGATSATYIPNASIAPFNTPGTYYIYRNALLSSANNVSPNPYVATSESNASTLVVNLPLITTTPTSLTGFSYTFGSGPSPQQSFTVGGTYLIANITVTPSTNFEISTTSGSGFQSTPITLNQSAGTVTTTTIYVRLKTGLAAASYNLENISLTSTNAVTSNVTCSGTVNSIPLITTSPTSLTGFNYVYGNGPSVQQSFTVGGTYLIANITVTPSTDYEISTISGSGFQSTPITLTQVGGTVATTTIYVRLKTGLAIASYNAENIASTSSTAVTKNVTCSGTVTNVPLITSAPTSLTGFNYIFGSGPSAQQSFTVGGTYLIANLIVAPSTDYEISTVSGSGFQSTPITLSPVSGTVPTTTIYIRLKAGLAIASYNAENIVSSSTSAVSKNVACSGTVTNVPLITTTPTSLTGLSYIVGYGPSAQQSFTVGGTSLIANIVVTPPADYEISTVSGSGFLSTPITLTQVSGTVATTTIYVRLKAGLAVASYNAENIASTSTSAVTKNVTCSGTVFSPTITTSVATLTGFSYPFGYGPSGEQTFTVSGTNLTSNITVIPSASFEISTGSGASFVPTNPVTCIASGGTVNNTTIYVRMITGLALGAVAAENVAATATGATTKNVACSGTVVSAPVITTSVSSLSGLNYTFTAGPSTQQSFTVSGSNLVGNIIVTPSTNFEISTTSGTGFVSSPVTLTQSGGNLGTTTIYVRLKISLGAGSYSEDIVCTSAAAAPKTVTCNGSVNPSPTIIATKSALSGFIYALANGPSGQQSVGIIGTNLSAGIVVTPPANFEISTTSGSGFVTTAITLPQSGGNVNMTIYARMVTGLAVATYGPSNVLLTSTGAVVKSVSLSGKVVSTSTPTILTSKTAVTGFGYMQGTGPSAEQTFTVSGAALGANNITVTPPANFEISTTSGSGFHTTAITLTQSGGRVNPTTIFVRLKSGLAAGNYTGVNIGVAAVGVTTINISLVGIVFVSPLITAGGGGSFCEGSTINLTSVGADIVNRYWQGPNSFYSTSQNPTLTTNATTNMSGTYTVTGNVYVGGNLITNGDFEAGNSSFGSSYGYVAPTANALQPEGLYTVVASPRTVHDSFSACSDHTIGGGTPTGLQMVINGYVTPGVVIWTQSVPVVPGASYEFSYWVQTVVATSPSQLQLYVNGVSAGPTYTADLTTCTWKQFIYNTTAGPSTTSINLELINQNIIANGNDFTLDDIVFKQILPATSSVSVTVNPNLPVSVTVAPSANPVYSGTPVTFTATPTNGGTTPSYQWKVNGVNAGTNSATYVYTPLTGDVVSCVMTSSYVCATGNPASNAVTMTVIHRTNYWMGSIDTDWGKTGNWTSNYIPLAGDDVEYATVGNFGSTAVNDLILDNDRTIGNLINATTKKLVIPKAKGLIVNYTITTDGNPNRIYIQSSDVAANGSLTFHNAVSLPVNATVEMYSKASWNLNDPIPGNRYKWQYFGIPLRSVVAQQALSGSYVRKWYESGTTISNHWLQLHNDSVLTSFLGYEICQQSPTTIVFQGQLENGNFNSGQLAVTPTALYPGQHVYANPYTAAIDIRQLTFGSQTEATVYMYNTGTYSQWTSGGQATPGNNPGQYTAVPKNTAGNNSLPRQIPSMQALLVKAMSNSSAATFGISYNSVVMNNTDQQRVVASKEVASSDKVCTMIDVTGANYSDRMWIFSDPSCTHHFDNGWDGAKLLGSSLTPQIYAVESDGNYQVDGVDDIGSTVLGFQAGVDVNYTMTFTHSNVKNKYAGLYLTDKVENKTIDITESGSSYSFVTETTNQTLNRFILVTRPYEKGAPDLESQLKIFSSKGSILVQNFSNVNGELIIYDIAGHYLKKATLAPNGVVTIVSGLIPGAYIGKAVTSKESVAKRLIVQ